MSFNEVANTNIQKVFELILRTAVNNNLPQSELPSTVYIISDMEFDYCTKGAELTNFEYAEALFKQNGYTLPSLVFWNVDSRNAQQPVTMNEKGVVLVSGSSPRVFSMVTSCVSPYVFMMETLNAERYARVTA
jgi:Rad3-related DNA helicase